MNVSDHSDWKVFGLWLLAAILIATVFQKYGGYTAAFIIVAIGYVNAFGNKKLG